MQKLDREWLRQHPLPPATGGDKNARGRVLVVGGAEFVPGALRLTGEAVLRAGAGKLQLATVRAAAVPLAVLMPEASMIALPADEDGEIAAEAASVLSDRLGACDALVVGPGMSVGERTEQLVAAILAGANADQTIVLDAAALTSCRNLKSIVASHQARIIMTPHHGEMAHLTGKDAETVAADPATAAEQVAQDFGAVVALKSERTVVAGPDLPTVVFEGGNIGLATSGSGDVLAGIVGGLASRGTDPFTATGWAVHVHGAAGDAAAAEFATIGYLARDLLRFIPGLLASSTLSA